MQRNVVEYMIPIFEGTQGVILKTTKTQNPKRNLRVSENQNTC